MAHQVIGFLGVRGVKAGIKDGVKLCHIGKEGKCITEKEVAHGKAWGMKGHGS